MLPAEITMHLRTFFLVVVLSSSLAQDRQIIADLNPDCTKCITPATTLIYIKAQGAKDSIHQIWDFTRGIPTFIFAVGSVNSTMSIKWDDLEPVDFKMSEDPQYSFAMLFDQILEYDDVSDVGGLDALAPRRAHALRGLRWARTQLLLGAQEATAELRAPWGKGGGYLQVKLDLLPFTAYAPELPRLIHTANSTLVDLSLVDAAPARGFNASRYAWRALLASTDPADDTMHFNMRKSLDDEHTPGVFEIVEIRSPSSQARGAGGYLSFRPVGYYQRARGVASSTVAHVGDFNRTELPAHSTARIFYSGWDPARLLLQSVLVSFGEPGDGFYALHNYTAWTLSMGFGSPPLEGFSPFVVAVLALGLGVPAALALSGAGFVLARRLRRDPPRRLLQDD